MSTTNFDFQSIRDRIITRLREKESWKDILYYGGNTRLIDAFSEELEYQAQYDEFLTREIKWGLARQRSSLVAESQFFNYIPHRKIGSTGKLRVSTSKTFNSSYPFVISIPKFSVFKSNTGISFISKDTVNLLSSQNYLDIDVVQGDYREFDFIATGVDFETFFIDNPNIENSIFDVKVNGIDYMKVDYIREANKTNLFYSFSIENAIDFSGVFVQFGNGYFGRRLNAGDIINIKCIETLGDQGNILSSGIVTKVVSSFVDTDVPPKSVVLYCNNIEAIEGGSNYEDVEDIRVKAPKSFGSGGSVITKDDYEGALYLFPFVKKSIVWGETEINIDNGDLPGTYIPVEENLVYIAVISNTGNALTSGQESEIRDYLNEKKPPVDIVRFVDPSIVYLNFITEAFVQDRKYALSQVQSAIITVLQNTYGLDAMNFKQNIYYSDYISAIDNIDGVAYHNTNIKLHTLTNLNMLTNSADLNSELLHIKANSIKVYVRDLTDALADFLLLAHDDGSSNLVADVGFTIGASSINYSTGIGNINITSGINSNKSYELKLEYEIDTNFTNNILPPKRNQILLYSSSNVQVSYL